MQEKAPIPLEVAAGAPRDTSPHMNALARDESLRPDRLTRSLRPLAAALFGLIFPLVLLWQAYSFVGNSTMRGNFQAVASDPAQIPKLASPNDYKLYAMIYVESSNRNVMLNKQMMKMAVVHIGFAVISIGMLFLLLGIEAGGMQVDGKYGPESQVNLKVASTGVLIFLIGAGMAALGGITKNEYSTPDIPNFSGSSSAAPAADLPKQAMDEYDRCHTLYEKDALHMRACLANWMDDAVQRGTP